MSFAEVERRNLAVAMVAGLVAAPTAASAYVGPGAGLTFIASLVAVGAAAVIMIVGLVAFPIRMMMKKARQRRAAGSGEP